MAEAMYLGTPMVMVLPTYFPGIFYFPGLLGILGEIPLIGLGIKYLIVAVLSLFKKRLRFALPNILLGKQIVPELIGRVSPESLAQYLIKIWQEPEFFEKQHQEFQKFQPNQLVADRIVEKVKSLLTG